MPNRSREENLSLLTTALQRAAEKGISIEEAGSLLFGKGTQNKSAAKKLLEELKFKGYARAKMAQDGIRYFTTQSLSDRSSS